MRSYLFHFTSYLCLREETFRLQGVITIERRFISPAIRCHKIAFILCAPKDQRSESNFEICRTQSSINYSLKSSIGEDIRTNLVNAC